MGTKNNPGTYDCYANAGPDEPVFVLLARDPNAPDTIEFWAAEREGLIEQGSKPERDRAIVDEARQCAKTMREWRAINRPRK